MVTNYVYIVNTHTELHINSPLAVLSHTENHQNLEPQAGFEHFLLLHIATE